MYRNISDVGARWIHWESTKTIVGYVTGPLVIIEDVIFHGARLRPDTDCGQIQTSGSRQIHRDRRAASHVKTLQRQLNTSLSLSLE
jgi:hypothetical protein